MHSRLRLSKGSTNYSTGMLNCGLDSRFARISVSGTINKQNRTLRFLELLRLLALSIQVKLTL